MTTLIFRVRRNGHWTDVPIEQLTPAERRQVMEQFTADQRHAALDQVCAKLVQAERVLQTAELHIQ